jgi:S-layer homology domain
MRVPGAHPDPARALVRRCVLLVSVLFGIAALGRAASAHWKATPVDGNWSNGNNWTEGHPPNSGDDLTFPVSSTILATNNDLAAGLDIIAITFEGSGYTLAGNGITSGEILCTSAVVGANTISLPMTVNSTIVVGTPPGCSLTLSGDIDGAGGILATGGGPVILSGNDGYTGSTTAGATSGVLIIDGNLFGTDHVKVLESSGNATLGGHGSFIAPLDVDNAFPTDTATVSPGHGTSTGVLSTGSADFGASSTRTVLAVKLNGLTAGSEYDQLSVNGNVTLEKCLLQVTLNFTPPGGSSFTVIRNTGGVAVSGEFDGLAEGARFLVKSTEFQITYAGGDSGQDVVLSVSPTDASPTALAVDEAGNGVFEMGETVTFAPTWKNTSGSTVSLSGNLSDFGGIHQPGTVFSIPDDSGSYGSIADGGSAACVDCYTLGVTAPSRPAQHWDAQINETIAPFSIIKTWAVHVGGSFPDVPTSHPFYKFIENLFHNGVTGGCAGGGYCPSNPVTRAQMAVFLLKGEHGSSYTPPACAATMFPDEPCPGGPFVDWVNQLASESITGGCGGGDYCPGNSVTRGQMAVFLLKGEHGGAYAPPACSATVFADVPCPTGQFVNFINQLAAEGITGGCGGGDYCPGTPVNRGQMAVFLDKAFSLLLYGP